MDLIKEFISDLKSGFNWFINLSPKVKKQKYLMYGFIGLVLLVLFLISHSYKDNGLTDWISALANVVMAGAAIVGIIYAKNYILQHSIKDGYATAAELKIIGIPSLKPDVFHDVNISIDLEYINNIISSNKVSVRDLYEIYISFGFINSQRNKYGEILKAYDLMNLKLQTHGWSIVETKEADYGELRDSADEYYSMLCSLYIFYTKILQPYVKGVSNEGFNGNISHDDFISQLRDNPLSTGEFYKMELDKLSVITDKFESYKDMGFLLSEKVTKFLSNDSKLECFFRPL